jgi:hypothetical protein
MKSLGLEAGIRITLNLRYASATRSLAGKIFAEIFFKKISRKFSIIIGEKICCDHCPITGKRFDAIIFHDVDAIIFHDVDAIIFWKDLRKLFSMM